MSRCPFCEKETGERAWRCRHCGEYLEGRQAIWLDYLSQYQASTRREKKLLLLGLDAYQQAFFKKLLAGKYDRWLSEKPRRFSVRAKTVRAFAWFTALCALVVILGASLCVYPYLKPFFFPLNPGRSTAFDVPLPLMAKNREAYRGHSASPAKSREDYTLPGPAESIFQFFDQQLSDEGWSRFGTREGGSQVYRKGNRWLGVMVPPEGGGFALVAPPR